LALPLFIYGSFLLVRQDIISLSVNRQNIWGLVIVFMFMAASLVSMRQAHTKVENRIVTAMVLILIVLLPRLTDMFQNAVLSKVFIFAAVGIGLNIVIGYAGMLHLGFAAFFAVGAYSFGLLTSPSSYFVQNPEGLAWLESFDALGFWSALPIAIIISTIIGLLLGLPILRTRGDYLAIVTLGFSEIIRLLFLNLRDHTGGPGGILNIPSAELFDINLGTTMGVVYMGMVLTGVVIFISMRLRQSRLGRAWMAMREDEDVAQMMGVNPANMKLLAFAIGSAFAGAAGVLYTSRQVNIFPDNFDLQTSIDILSLIIIGGLGSIEGVVLGAIALVGLPEVLRGVDEYRIVAFGALLVIMMIVRPEGLMPSAQRQLELHQEDLSQDAWLEMAGVEAEANDEDAPDQENQSEDMN
jgi:branched-chain amino acid transport system permease protein